LTFAESGKKKEPGRPPQVAVSTTHHFAGTHDERMARIRDAAAKAMRHTF
jgi:hypothetical protein